MNLKVQWSGTKPWLKGGIIGWIVSLIGLVFILVNNFQTFVFSSWDSFAGMSDRTSDVLGWAFIYSFLALIVSAIMYGVLFVLLFSLGSGIGWVYGRMQSDER